MRRYILGRCTRFDRGDRVDRYDRIPIEYLPLGRNFPARRETRLRCLVSCFFVLCTAESGCTCIIAMLLCGGG